MKKVLPVFLLCTFILMILMPFTPVAADDVEVLLYSFTFEDEAADGEFFTHGESINLFWTNFPGVGHGDDHALRVEHFGGDYLSFKNAVRLTLPRPLAAGGVYRIVSWTYVPSDENQDKGVLTGPGIVLNDDYPGAQGVVKFPVSFGTINMDEWKSIDVVLPVSPNEISVIDFRFVINDKAKHPDVWYWDNIEIYQIGGLEDIEIPEWDLTLPSLAEAYKDYFPVGNIITPNASWMRTHSDAFIHFFNAVTAENAMKPLYVALESGQYNFSGTDIIIDWSREHSIPVHGHTLIWHEQSADWLTKDSSGNALTREAASANMQAYITEYAGRYAGDIASWDVVNEAFDNSVSDGTNWKNALRTNSPWYRAYNNGTDRDSGEHPSDYIYDAFVFTRLAAPDAVLFYNDFNEEESGKRNAMASMAEELNLKWETDPRNNEPERLLIEGIGMQSHYWTDNLDPADVRDSIQRFIRAGLRIRVTELDVVFGNYGTYRNRTSAPTEAELELQANLYEALFKIYVDFAEHIDAVTIWGLIDNMNWRGSGYPMLFDELHNPKPAFWSVIEIVDPGAYERFMSTQPAVPTPPPESSPTPTPPASPPETSDSSPTPQPDDSGFPWWGFLLIGIGAAILVALLLITLMKNKKREV